MFLALLGRHGGAFRRVSPAVLLEVVAEAGGLMLIYYALGADGWVYRSSRWASPAEVAELIAAEGWTVTAPVP